MQDLKISIIQTPLFWEDHVKNVDMFFSKIKDGVKGRTDLIILPEMFTTGFSMNAKHLSEENQGFASGLLQALASMKKSYACGSAIFRSNKKYYNRLMVSSPEGEIRHYDKRHLFTMAGEQKVYSRGNKRLIMNIRGWRVAFFICYDLRFPVWCRNKKEYDIAVFVANWPAKREEHWKALLKARAIENQCYVIGVNRTGEDGNGIKYSGQSAIINPLGEYIVEAKSKNGVFSAGLNYKMLEELRKTFPVLNDAEKFKIVI